MHIRRSFSLIEILIVLVIMGILASVSINAYGNAKKKVRDATRKTDLQTVRAALAQYRLINNSYPYELGTNIFYSKCGRSTWPVLATKLKPYLSTFPTDPLSKCTTIGSTETDYFPWARPTAIRHSAYAYVYQNLPGVPAFPSYSLWAALENPRDLDRDGSVTTINTIVTPGKYTDLFRYASLFTVYNDIRNLPNIYGVGCRVVLTDPDPTQYQMNKCVDN